jgi:hypothetical protein
VAHSHSQPLIMITAFAVPSPSSTAVLLVFSGLGVRRVTSVGESPSLLRMATCLEANPFGRRQRKRYASARRVSISRAENSTLYSSSGFPIWGVAQKALS